MKIDFNAKVKLKNVDKLKKEVDKLGKYYTKLGVFGSEATAISKDIDGEATGMTLGELANVVEYGSFSDNRPARPVLGLALEMNKQEYKRKVNEIVSREFGKPNMVEKIYEKLGALGKYFIIDVFENEGYGQWAPLAKKTVAYKKRIKKERINVITGQLSNAYKWEVVKENS